MNDTSPEAERVLRDVYRRMSPQTKAKQVSQLSSMVRALCEAGFRRLHPDATEEQVVDYWMRQTLSKELYRDVRRYCDELARGRLEGTGEDCGSAQLDVDSLRRRRVVG
jgi:hypothetical protein